MSSTLKLAAELAGLLSFDPILAAQVKKELGPRFFEIFATSKDEPPPEGKFEDSETSDILQALVEREVPLSEVMRFYRTAAPKGEAGPTLFNT